MTTINLKKTSSDEILVHLYNYAEKIEKSSKGSVRMHFWGSESWDTDFDKDSGKLKVGVLAKDPQMALAMMILIKYTVYEHESTDILYDVKDMSDDDIVSIEETIELLGGYSDGYRESFDLNETYKIKYHTRTTVDGELKYIKKEATATFQDVNVYTLARIVENVPM